VPEQMTIQRATQESLGADLESMRKAVVFAILHQLATLKRAEQERLEEIDKEKSENATKYAEYIAFCERYLKDEVLPFGQLPEYLHHQVTLQGNLSNLKGLVEGFVTEFSWSAEAKQKREVCLRKITYLLDNCERRIDFVKDCLSRIGPNMANLPEPEAFHREIGFLW